MGYVGGELAPAFRQDSTDRALKNMARLGVREAREITEKNTPVETGDLRASWEVSPVRPMVSEAGLPGVGATWYTELEYAPYVEHGTGLWGPEHKKYLIEPKIPGGVLHFVGNGGQDVFTRRVWHPGSPGQHMVAIAAAMVEHTFHQIVRPALNWWVADTERQFDGAS